MWLPKFEKLMEVWRSSGKKPASLENRPKLTTRLIPIVSMYRELAATGREHTQDGSPKPIRLRVMRDYWEVFDLGDALPFEDFFNEIRQIDHVYLKVVTEGLKRRTPATKTQPKHRQKR